jgi:ataxin-3
MAAAHLLSASPIILLLQVIPYLSSDPAAVEARRDPTAQQAFICNLEEHWFTVRQLHGQWWDLNSLFPAPKPLSAFYLAAYLDSLRDQGYTIFVINGPLPPSHPPTTAAERFVPGQAGRWFTPEEAKQATQVGASVRPEDLRSLPA